MENYNFWRDFFDTYQSLSDWLELAWLLMPPAFILGFTALILHFRLGVVRMDRTRENEARHLGSDGEVSLDPYEEERFNALERRSYLLENRAITVSGET